MTLTEFAEKIGKMDKRNCYLSISGDCGDYYTLKIVFNNYEDDSGLEFITDLPVIHRTKIIPNHFKENLLNKAGLLREYLAKYNIMVYVEWDQESRRKWDDLCDERDGGLFGDEASDDDPSIELEQELDGHARNVSETYEELKQAIGAYNKVLAETKVAVNEGLITISAFEAALAEPKSVIEKALEDLNNAITDANGWREFHHDGRLRWWHEDPTEEWQESDDGQSYWEWIEDWSAEFDGVEMELPDSSDLPEPLDVPDCDVEYKIRDLSVEP